MLCTHCAGTQARGLLPEGRVRSRSKRKTRRQAVNRGTAVAIALLVTLLGPARAIASEERVELIGRPGIMQPILYEAAAAPVASVILFVGGGGDLAHADKSDLKWMRQQFIAASMSIAVPDTPSDHPAGFGPLFRAEAAHAQDVAAVVALLKRQVPAPVWLVGVSNGTISAANAAVRLGPHAIAGVVLISSVWLGGMSAVPVEQIAVPVLLVHNRSDDCPASPFAETEKSLSRFAAAPAKELIAVASGGARGSEPCGLGSPHDFHRIKDKVLPPIIAWIKAHG